MSRQPTDDRLREWSEHSFFMTIGEAAAIAHELLQARQILRQVVAATRFELREESGPWWHVGQFESHPVPRKGCPPCLAHAVLTCDTIQPHA